MNYCDSKTLLAARALAAKDWSNPKVILAARHLAHEGATIIEIASAVGWDVTESGARVRLKRFNIRPLPAKLRKAKHGFLTTLSSRNGGVDLRSYKPKAIAA